jgi:hypothetical protein
MAQANTVEGMREDVMWCASKLQDSEAKIAAALAADPTARKEMRQLVGDLFSLIEVLVSED